MCRSLVSDPLDAGDVTYPTQGSATDLAYALGDRVRHGVELIRLLVQQQVIVAKVWSAHMPVEVLRLDIKCEDVRENGIHSGRDIPSSAGLQVGGRYDWGPLSTLPIIVPTCWLPCHHGSSMKSRVGTALTGRRADERAGSSRYSSRGGVVRRAAKADGDSVVDTDQPDREREVGD